MSSEVHPPAGAVSEAVGRALAEDLGPRGDLTAALLPPGASVEAVIAARAPGVLAGRLAADEAFRQVDLEVAVGWRADDGDRLDPGSVLATVAGPLASVLTAERTALNFLCHLSGVATMTAHYVEAVKAAGGTVRIRDTRKTTPGLRVLEKAAVRAGGGVNHRASLSDGILVKDNHLAGLSIEEAVAAAHTKWPGQTVQVECDTAEQVKRAVVAGAELVLLDNMSPTEVRSCVDLVSASVAGRSRGCLVEVSGGVNLENIADFAVCGADFISIGAITHSAPALDIGLDLAGR